MVLQPLFNIFFFSILVFSDRTLYTLRKLYSKRRHDAEVFGLESVWVEICTKQKPVLFGCFYLAPNSDANALNNIEASIDLAFDILAGNLI